MPITPVCFRVGFPVGGSHRRQLVTSQLLAQTDGPAFGREAFSNFQNPNMTPKFDANSTDRTTFAPFILHDCRASKWKDLHLEFSDWDWLQERCGGDTFDCYYLN